MKNPHDIILRPVLTEKAYVITVNYTDTKLTFSATDGDGEEIYSYEFDKG